MRGAASRARQRPRLLVLSPVFPPARGGIETLAGRLADVLHERFELQVLTLAAGTSEPDPVAPYAVSRLANVPRGGRRSIARLNAVGAVRMLRDRPDVALSLHVRAGVAATATRFLRAVPLVQYVHAKELLESPATARHVLERSRAVIAVSGYSRELAIAAGADPARIEVVPNGVDPAPPRTHERDPQPTIVTVSRLEDAYKGHDVLVEAMRSIRERVATARWVVIGDGSLRGSLEARVADAGLGAVVEFRGAVTDAERDAWLERASVFAMPSRMPGPGRAGDAFGIVFMEAAARGLPVVAGRVPGVVDAVADGVSGLLVDPTDPAAVADAVAALLTDRALADRIGERARERASSFAWPLVAERVMAVLEQAIAGGAGLSRAPTPGYRALGREFLTPLGRHD